MCYTQVPLSDIDLQAFSSLFISITMPFEAQKVLILMKCSLFTFASALAVIPEKSLPNSRSWRFIPPFSFKEFYSFCSYI